MHPTPSKDPQVARSSISQPQSGAEQGLRYGLRDGACQAVTQGSGEQYLSAFALLLQASPFQLSLLSALPQLVGTVAQIISVKVLQWCPNRKALISAGTIGQALTWIPIVLLPLVLPQWGPWLVVGGAAAYFACAHFTAPAWNSLIADCSASMSEAPILRAEPKLLPASVSLPSAEPDGY